jgi:nanoRNase/pAp phosphatase (c-di-AMP/oligoRNAs hydrolase)
MKQPFGKSASFTEKYKRLLGLVGTRDVLAILIQADPDALASAMALKRLFWRHARQVGIYRINQLARPDNRAFVKLLNVDQHHIRQLKKSTVTKWALVDSQPEHHEAFANIPFDIIIDHHPLTEHLKAPFIDIRPEYGANATLLTEYLKAARIKPSPRLATALFYGIKADTDDFVRNSISRDIINFRFLYEFTNRNIIKKIESSELSVGTLKTIQTAAKKVSFLGETAFVHLGPVSSADKLVIVADFLMKLSEATWSVVSGTRHNKLVVIFRNAGFRRHAGRRAQAAFGEIGKAGGRQSAARAEVALSRVEVEKGSPQAYETFVRRRLKKAASRPN